VKPRCSSASANRRVAKYLYLALLRRKRVTANGVFDIKVDVSQRSALLTAMRHSVHGQAASTTARYPDALNTRSRFERRRG
jgi:hypothetical protein